MCAVRGKGAQGRILPDCREPWKGLGAGSRGTEARSRNLSLPGHGLHRGIRAENPHAEGGQALPNGRFRGVACGRSGSFGGRRLKGGGPFFENGPDGRFAPRELSPGGTSRIMGNQDDLQGE